MQSRDCFESVGDRLNSFTSVNNIQASPEDHKESPPAVNYFETPNIQISFNVMNLESSFTLNIPQISVTPLYFGQPGSSSSDVVQNSIHESLDSVNMESLQNGEERDQEKKYQVSSDSSTLLMKSQAPWPLLQENTSFNSFGKTPDEQLELGRSSSQTIQKQESSSTSKIDESNQSAFFGATVHGALKEHHKKYIPQTEPKLNEVQEVFDFRHSSFNIPSYVGNEKILSGNGVWQLPTLQEEMQSTPSINVIIPLKSSQSSSGNGIYQNTNELHFKNHESTYTSKTPTFPFDHQILERIESLKQKVAKLDSKVSLSNDDLTQRLMMALSQVVGFQIDDQQSSFDEFLRSFKIKLTSTIFIDSVKETNFLKLNQLMEAEPELKSKLDKINPEVLLYLQVALQVQNIYKLRSQKNQKNSQELTSLGSDGSMQFPESIKINPIIMDLNFFSLPPLCDLHPEDTQFEEQKQFFNENLTPTMINIERSFLMGSDLEMPNSFVLPLQSKQASSIKHNNSTMQEHVDEVADQLKKLEEEEQFKISTSKLYFNRKMDVEVLDLRGLSSDDESASWSADMKQQHFRKPFNKFKEDKSDTINESTDEHDYQRIGMRASHNLSPQFLNQNRETVKRKKQSKNRRDPSDWPKHGEVINEGIRRPQLNTNKSMTNAMSSFKSHEAMTDMQQRYMAFNSYIQAQNRIESLVSENSHLQKLLFSSQHDLRLLQRFTKSYFKSMEFFKQKDILTDDAATHKVLMSCFQDKPVVLLAFSSPLVRKVENMVTQKVTLTEMPLLDFTKEFAGVVNGIQETRNAIKIAYVQATVEKLFQFCIDENPVGIHFSGHGVSNEISMNGVSCLVMETEDGCAHYLSEDQLTKFIKDLNNPLKFVFLSSCHSEFAGYLFHLAGVDHVICVKQNEEIYDKAAIILAKHFYNFLFSERNTVCKAFERAKMFLSSNADPKLSAEANKFIMIKDSDDISDRIQERLLAHNDISLGKRRNFATKAKKHQCKVLGPFLPGQIEVINKKPPFPFEIKMNPSDQIIGRQLDIQSIVDSIKQKNRVVIVQGMVGIGKSVVIKKVGQFFHDRESFRDGVIYFSMRDRNWVNQLISKMHNFISTNKTEDDYDDIDLSKDQSLTSSSEAEGGKSQFNVSELREGEATEIPQIAQEFKQIVDRQKVHEIWTCLSKRECLVIVDNTENLLRDDEQQFNKLFEILLEKCPEIQLLISANEHFKHKIPETFFYYLPPISNQHSLELLQLKSGHCITQQEIRELLQKTSMSKRNENGPKVSKLQDHHLCTILGGHQGAITLLAPLFKNRSLFEFYKTLLKMFEDPSLLQDIGEIGSYHTLKISLTAMTKHLQKTNPLAIQLFSLVSLMPGGVFEKDLTVIWGSVKWIVLAEGLMQSSLMSVKVEKMSGEHHGKRKYSLLQFINKFAESLLSQSKLQEFHERICENLCIKIQHYSNNCSVEHAKHKQQQYQMEILDIEINIWACIYRILDFNTPKEEHHKLKTKLKQNYLHHQAGDSSAEENNHKVIVHGTVDFSEISDTCDERLIKDFDREELSTITKNVENTNKSISPSETDRNKGSSNGLSKLSEIKHSSNDQNKEKKPYVGLAVRMKKSHAQQQKFKKIINQPQIESRGRIQSLSIQFREQLKQNFRIEKRVSHQLAQIEKTQLKLMKEYPQEQQLNNEDKVQNKLILSDESACQKFFYEIQEQSDNGSLIEEKQVSQVDSVVAQNQFEQCQFSRENSTQRQHPKRQETNNSMQIWTRGSAASQQFLNISPRAHSVGDVSESFSIQQTYFTQKNPQDNIDCSYPQTENTQMNNTENFGDELQMQNLTYLKESEHDLTPRQMHSHEKQDELPLSVTSDISVIFQRDQRFSQPDHDMQSSAVEEDINPFSSASQNRPVEEGNPTMGFMPRSVGLQISINQERTDDQKRTPRTLTTSLHTTPLTTIEESYYKEMTSEQKLIVTYISLLVMSKRIPFALRAISLVDQHLKLKLICHANLTKLYGLCILKSKSEWIKDAFELFRRAKQIFKMVGGENNNQNIGVAQCYMIQGLLLKTKSEQIFAPMQLSQAVVDKRAIKRFEAAKQIYKERKHLAGQLFCCSELINIKKSMKAKYMHLVNEQKELESKLNGMYSEDSKLVYGTGSNSFFFIKRLDEMEFSLLVEMADYHQIVRIDVLTKKQLNPRTHLNKLVDKQSEQKPKEQWMSSTTINRKQPPKQKRAKIEFRQVQVPDHIVSPGSEMECEKKIATQIEGETEDNEESKSIKPRRKPENKVLTKRTTTIIDSKKAQEKFLTQKNRQEITNMEETGAQEGEKPIRRKKYAHIQPKVNTHRKPFDHGISIDLNEQSSEWATESLK